MTGGQREGQVIPPGVAACGSVGINNMAGKRRLTHPYDPPPQTFMDWCAERHLTPDERIACVWHLAAFRARKTVESLLPETWLKEVLR